MHFAFFGTILYYVLEISIQRSAPADLMSSAPHDLVTLELDYAIGLEV